MSSYYYLFVFLFFSLLLGVYFWLYWSSAFKVFLIELRKKFSLAQGWVSHQRKRFFDYLFATAAGRAVKSALEHLLRDHQDSFVRLLLLSCLVLAFSQGKLTLGQGLVFALMQQVVLHCFKAKLRELAQAPKTLESETKKLYYSCLIFAYVNFFLLLCLFWGDFYSLLLWLDSLVEHRK